MKRWPRLFAATCMTGSLVLLALSIAGTCSGCSYCLQPAHKADLACQAQQIASKCGEPAVFKLVLQILPEVVGDLVSGDYSAILGHLISTLEQQGVADAAGVVTCAVEQADGNIALKGGAALNPNLVAIKTHAQVWLGEHK